MDTPTQNATITEHPAGAKKTTVNELNAKTRYQSSPFKPRATLLLDVLPDDDLKMTNPNPAAPSLPLAGAGGPDEPEGMLQQLLINTEASAERTQSAKMKWQLATLVLVMLFVTAGVVIGWMAIEMNAGGNQQGRLAMERQTLKAQFDTASAQITGLKTEIETLVGRNLELVDENAKLKSQRQTASVTTPAIPAKAEQKTTSPVTAAAQPVPLSSRWEPVRASSEQSLDSSRLEAIRKGTYPRGASRAELTAVLGEPDRIYKSRNYEQFVYFGQKPGRFWFVGEYLVQAGG